MIREREKLKRILVFGMSENFGGVETIIMNYYRYIDKSKIQFDFLYNTKSIAYENEIKALGGYTYKITPRAENLKKYKTEMNKFFKENAKKYSAIWVNLCILSNIDWLKYAKKYGIKCRILHSHNSKNMENFPKLLLHKLNKLFVENYATDYWACSEDAAKWFFRKKIIKKSKYKIINNAIDIELYEFNEKERDEYRKRLNLNGKFVIGHIGRLHFQKNHEFLIDIFMEIYKNNNNAYLMLIGTGEDYEKIKNKVEKYKISNNVMFLGKRDDVKQLFQTMDVFVFPSLFEGLPLVLLEAQANGLDVYVSKESVPVSIKMSQNLYLLSLKQSARDWAKEIIKKKHGRQENFEHIKKAGFDIKTETKKIQEFFEKI